jgi:hypothetical protein
VRKTTDQIIIYIGDAGSTGGSPSPSGTPSSSG